ncbi:MAG: lysophospholipid acyltransferase family protein [Elusimicrobia bacterium]|nr:lysophospholipid acyltransferase family protein [Elusimicrobiota bacterium]
MALGAFLGRLALLFNTRHSRVARENLSKCFPEWTEARREALLRKNYEHYGRMVLELAHMFAPVPGHFRAYVQRNVRIVGYENWEKAKARGKGVLFLGSHIANWEFAASVGALKEIPITIVTRRLKPAWLHDWMEKTRLSVGVRAAYQPRTIPAVMKALRDNGGVVFVMDQYMSPPMGEPMRLFGVRVHTLAAIAPLARRTGAAILPVLPTRDPDGTVRIIIEPEIPLGDDDKADNQKLADRVEAWMRAVPDQALWAHRRFKDVDWSDRVPAAKGAP